MELYKNLINEALEEDRKADREVLERLKKNYMDNKEKLEGELQLNPTQERVLKRLVSLMLRDMNVMISMVSNDWQSDEVPELSDYIGRIADIVSKYNNISVYIGSIGYNKLNNGSKSVINSAVDKVLQSLQSLIYYLDPEAGLFYGASEELDLLRANLEQVYNEIQFRNYKLVYPLEDYKPKEKEKKKKEAPKEEEEEEDEDEDEVGKVMKRYAKDEPQEEDEEEEEEEQPEEEEEDDGGFGFLSDI